MSILNTVMPDRKDPLTVYHFALEIDGVGTATFKECSGIGSESDVIESRESTKTGKIMIRKQPGNVKWDDITFKRGMTNDTLLYKWRQEVLDNKMTDARRNCSIIMFNEDGGMVRFNLVNAWPKKLVSPGSLDVTSSNQAIEELTIVHEGMTRE